MRSSPVILTAAHRVHDHLTSRRYCWDSHSRLHSLLTSQYVIYIGTSAIIHKQRSSLLPLQYSNRVLWISNSILFISPPMLALAVASSLCLFSPLNWLLDQLATNQSHKMLVRSTRCNSECTPWIRSCCHRQPKPSIYKNNYEELNPEESSEKNSINEEAFGSDDYYIKLKKSRSSNASSKDSSHEVDDALSAILSFTKSKWSDAERLQWLRMQLIGDKLEFETPFGTRQLLYADHTASGRSLLFIESFIMQCVLPFYGTLINSH